MVCGILDFLKPEEAERAHVELLAGAWGGRRWRPWIQHSRLMGSAQRSIKASRAISVHDRTQNYCMHVHVVTRVCVWALWPEQVFVLCVTLARCCWCGVVLGVYSQGPFVFRRSLSGLVAPVVSCYVALVRGMIMFSCARACYYCIVARPSAHGLHDQPRA